MVIEVEDVIMTEWREQIYDVIEFWLSTGENDIKEFQDPPKHLRDVDDFAANLEVWIYVLYSVRAWTPIYTGYIGVHGPSVPIRIKYRL